MGLLVRVSAAAAVTALLLAVSAEPARGQGDVVRAVLFFSPNCPHCHTVIQEDLPVIFGRFGGEEQVWVDPSVPPGEQVFYLVANSELELLLIDASKQAGYRLFEAATTSFGVPEERAGVPRLIAGDSLMVGAIEIPAHFPELIERARASGGLDWPEIPGLAEAMAQLPFPVHAAAAPDSDQMRPEEEAQGAEPEAEDDPDEGEPAADEAAVPLADTVTGDPAEPVGRDVAGSDPAPMPPTPAPREPVAEAAPPDSLQPTARDSAAGAATTLESISTRRESVLDRLRRDPVGNGIAVIVLLGMILVVTLVASGRGAVSWGAKADLAIPLLSLLGIVVAGYLSWVEVTGAYAVCGPVGDCNTVQQSEYAKVLGLIPVGVLGLIGYAIIIAAWLAARLGSGAVADWARVTVLGTAAVGTLFSIYLTFLEPFVIGATCAWCVASAVMITLLMWLSAGPGMAAWTRVRRP